MTKLKNKLINYYKLDNKPEIQKFKTECVYIDEATEISWPPFPSLKITIGTFIFNLYDNKTILNRIKYKIMELFFPLKVKWLK